ncbi:MAG: Flp pilus assembly complex ATPase component TadA, partial [Candidatus Omnitrophica bacterium]|nr:Flp pilus assembly complex ATPase component TadA [Candidatus Omnitrophota bacterium]
MARRTILFGALLVQRGLITPAQLEHALAVQQEHEPPASLGQTLLKLGAITEDALTSALAEQAGMARVHLEDAVIPPEAMAKVPPTFASYYGVMPMAVSEGVLKVAVADPFDVQPLDELKLLLNCEIRPVLASRREIQEAVQRHYGVGALAVERLLDGGAPRAEQSSVVEDLTAKSEDASVISFVNQLIRSAVRDRATDIHLEPFDQELRVRQRIDGVMYEVPTPAELFHLHQAVVSRIKVMARLDIAERRLPQDGRITVKLEEQELDLRVSILPTAFGESVEIRLLSNRMVLGLEELGLDPEHLEMLRQLIQRPHGIIFVTGPTGSGKTTTLYACLSRLNSPHRKILTIEDPVEYQMTGITQLQVHPKIGFSFSQGLRSMLRHDPDIMMVGEVRDPETAEITIRSALTGHLVFSTLHTNDAAGGVTRLLDMGIEPYLVASSVLCFIAQRLVRVVCAACAEDRPAEPGLREEFGLTGPAPATLRHGSGCAACKGTG